MKQHGVTDAAQITARGLLYADPNINPIPPIRFAITGGTDFYRLARGEITEGTPDPDTRLLDIQL